MRFALVFVFALGAIVAADDSDNTMEIALSFVKDCKGDYILCVKVYNFYITVKVLSENGTCCSAQPARIKSEDVFLNITSGYTS